MPLNTACCRERGSPTAELPNLAAFGHFQTLRPLPGGHRNAVWLVQGRSGHFVAKSTRRTQCQLLWLQGPQMAARSAGFIVPGLVAAPDGQLAPTGWTLEPFVSGVAATSLDLSQFGPRIESFHKASQQITQRPGFASLRALLREERSGDVNLADLPPDLLLRLRAFWAGVADTPLTAIHGDLGPANVVMTPDGPALLDWDEARVDYAFLDTIFVSPLSKDQTAAHLAFEIASCWRPEPDRARQLIKALTPFGSTPHQQPSASDPKSEGR